MSKTADEVKPNFGPVYAAALYPELAQICVARGYALAVHGSLARDFDLIAIPWVENPGTPVQILRAIMEKFAVKIVDESQDKPHGRKAYSLSVGFGECAVDLSFMPVIVR